VSARSLIISEVSRLPQQDNSDHLLFKPGINVIAGPPNSGKTQWLRIMDYLLGDDDQEEKLAEDVIEKYDSAMMNIVVDGERFCIERFWKQPGYKTKVVLNGESLDRREFTDRLLEVLDIPILHFPQGDPYGPRSWPLLSWRSLVRHIYRQQRFWSDIADKQPESEQHACLLQFLGIAKYLFSDEYGLLINNQKKINELKLKKEQYLSMLQEISVDILGAEDIGIALTPESIEYSRNRIKSSIDDSQNKKQRLITDTLEKEDHRTESSQRDYVQKYGEELASLNSNKQALLDERAGIIDRRNEIGHYNELALEELNRLKRAVKAADIMSPIKVTHCPVCDREIEESGSDAYMCVLCHRKLNHQPNTQAQGMNRVEFEYQQLESEVKESEELFKKLQDQQIATEKSIEIINDDIRQIENKLKPAKSSISAIVSSEITVCDMEIGRLEERLSQLNRISNSLKKREELSKEITNIQNEVDRLESTVSQQNSQVVIHESKPNLWPSQRRVSVDINRRDAKFFVDNRKWSTKLGGTTTLIFLMAYHYALLSLTAKDNFNYPGLFIVDFPAELDDGTIVRDQENFILEPFGKLLSRPEMSNSQVIAAGNSFEDLSGANRIEFRKIW